MKISTYSGFTLVELIITITILAILGTISINAYANYSKESRDAVRLTDLTNATNGLESFFAKNYSYPDVESPVDVKIFSTSVMKQGVLGKNALSQIETSDIVDPLDKKRLPYNTNTERSKYTLATSMEINPNDATINLSQLKDTERYLLLGKGSKGGLVFSGSYYYQDSPWWSQLEYYSGATLVDSSTPTIDIGSGSSYSIFDNTDGLLYGKGRVVMALYAEKFLNDATLGNAIGTGIVTFSEPAGKWEYHQSLIDNRWHDFHLMSDGENYLHGSIVRNLKTGVSKWSVNMASNCMNCRLLFTKNDEGIYYRDGPGGWNDYQIYKKSLYNKDSDDKGVLLARGFFMVQGVSLGNETVYIWRINGTNGWSGSGGIYSVPSSANSETSGDLLQLPTPTINTCGGYQWGNTKKLCCGSWCTSKPLGSTDINDWKILPVSGDYILLSDNSCYITRWIGGSPNRYSTTKKNDCFDNSGLGIETHNVPTNTTLYAHWRTFMPNNNSYATSYQNGFTVVSPENTSGMSGIMYIK